jgi:hypothetical protein
MAGLIKVTNAQDKTTKDTLNKHKVLLNDVDKKMDKVDGKMKQTQLKLNQYIQKSSSSCMMTTICIEIIIIIFLIITA